MGPANVGTFRDMEGNAKGLLQAAMKQPDPCARAFYRMLKLCRPRRPGHHRGGPPGRIVAIPAHGGWYSGYSAEFSPDFPSNHMVEYTMLGGLLIWLLARSRLHPGLKIPGIVSLLALIGMINVPRINAGAHWPSDVYGGNIIGVFFLSLMLLAYMFIKQYLAIPGF